MEAKSSAFLEGPARRTLSQEVLALWAWGSPDQEQACDLSKVLGDAPAHARVGLALWLQETASRETTSSDPEMKPERFPRRRSTRLMIPHTAGNSDRVLFSVRRTEPGLAAAEGASPAQTNGSYQVAVHGGRRARRLGTSARSLSEDAVADFTGVPAPAWIIAHQTESEAK